MTGTYDGIKVDLAYAIRQLKQFGDVERALDALERIQEALDRPAEEE